ncbi:hypothetical protein GCM10025779_09280 [Arthrobacter cryoconiti]
MTAEHNQLSPFANGPADNDAAEGGADFTARVRNSTPAENDKNAEKAVKPGVAKGPDLGPGIPVPSRFGAPMATILPIPTRMGRPLPSSNAPSAWPVPQDNSATDSTSENAAVEPQQAATPAATELISEPATDPYADESAYADTFYGQIGGHATFETIIHVFYEGIAADPLLRAMYHEEDLAPAERRMLMFMEQYWGGPRTYLEERGHPRLRMRHVPFQVTPEARDRWLAAMRKGVDAVELSPMHEATLWDYLERAAASLVNSASDPSQRA